MRETDVKGLSLSAGKAIASMPQGDGVIRRLNQVRSPEKFREFLEDVELGMAPRARTEFVDAITQAADWEDWKYKLLRAARGSRADLTAPSS